MTRDRTRRPSDPFKAAEAVFKPVAAQAPTPAPSKPAIPGVKESVTLRIDRDVLEHFQNEGPGWQDRINEALRHAAGIVRAGGLRPEELNSSNDD
jgi:uncharacterized protein (DUF4415 family)